MFEMQIAATCMNPPLGMSEIPGIQMSGITRLELAKEIRSEYSKGAIIVLAKQITSKKQVSPMRARAPPRINN